MLKFLLFALHMAKKNNNNIVYNKLLEFVPV